MDFKAVIDYVFLSVQAAAHSLLLPSQERQIDIPMDRLFDNNAFSWPDPSLFPNMWPARKMLQRVRENIKS